MKSFNVLNSTKNTIVATKVSRYTVYLLALVTVGVLALVVFGVKAWAQTVPSSDRNKVTMTLTQSANPGADNWAGTALTNVRPATPSPDTLAARTARATWDAAATSTNLYHNKLRISLRLPTGYLFIDDSFNAGTGGVGHSAAYKVKVVASRSACNAFNNNDGRENTTFGSSDAFFERVFKSGTREAHYRISGNSRLTSAEYMINRDPNNLGTVKHGAQLLTRPTGVTATNPYACVEAIYRKSAGDDNPRIYQYVAQRFTPFNTTAALKVNDIRMSVPNDPVKIGDTATLRVTFDRAVKLLAIRNASSALRGDLPYIRMKSNVTGANDAATYQANWRFTMARVPSSNSNVLEFKRVIQFGDEIISGDNTNTYQLLNSHLGGGVKIHLGGYYIVDAATGYLPVSLDPGSASVLAGRTFIARQEYQSTQTNTDDTYWNDGTNPTASATYTPDYFYQIDAAGVVKPFEIDIDTTPTMSVSRSGRNLVAKATPSSYRSGTTTRYTVDSGSWKVRTFTASSTTARPTTTRCDTDTGADYTGTITSRNSNDNYARGQAQITLPSTADNKWYCFYAIDNTDRSRTIASTWWRYVADSTAPALTFKVANNQVTITSSDAGSGISTDSFGWFLMVNENAQCLQEQAASLFGNSNNVINVRAPGAGSNNGSWICVRVADNAGNVKVQRYQLTRTATTTGTTTTPTTTPTTTTEEKPTAEAETTTTTTTDTPVANTGFLPANWGTLTTEQRVAHWASNKASFDTAWAALSTAQKIALNPYGCVVTQVRADNARCTQGSEGSVAFTGAATGTPTAAPTTTGTTTAETTVEEEATEEEATEEEATDEEATDGEEVATDEATGDTTPAATTDTTTTDTVEESSSNTTTIIMIVAAVVVVVIIIVVVMSGRRGNSL